MRRHYQRLALAALVLGGCASNGASRPVSTPGARDEPRRVAAPVDLSGPDLEESALLLLLVDRQLYEPFSIGKVLATRRPDLLRLLGLTLARVPDARAMPAVEELAIDADAGVRLAAAFAAGRIGGSEAITLLEGLLVDADPRVGSWACHGLARAGVPLAGVVERLAALERGSRQARILPDLHRFAPQGPSTTYQAIALEGLESADPWLRSRALHALVAASRPAQRPVFARLLQDPDPAVRAAAAAGLGEVGGADDLEALRAATAAAEAPVAIAALAAGAAIVDAGRAAAPEGWRATLVERMTDSRPAVRAAALAAAGAWLARGGLGVEGPAGEDVEAAVMRAARSGPAAERGRALLALAGAGAPSAAQLALDAAGDADPWVRARVARAAAWLGSGALLDRLAGDASALVREAAFLARADLDASPRPQLQARALADPAVAVRTAALERLARAPILPFESILTAFAEDERAEPELALAGVAALAARAAATPTERGAIVAALEGLAEVGGYAVRLRAADAVEALGRPRPSIGSATIDRDPGDYRIVVARTRRPRWLRLETVAGAAILRLDCPAAALSCLSFLQLLEQGFYDGSPIYRATPGARIETGDPDGDGRGGPGFTLRDEPAPVRLRAGAFGLVRPAPHAGGGRFFVQLADAPELEGEVTVMGEVVDGLGLLGGLLEGDRIVRLRETDPPPAPGRIGAKLPGPPGNA